MAKTADEEDRPVKSRNAVSRPGAEAHSEASGAGCDRDVWTEAANRPAQHVRGNHKIRRDAFRVRFRPPAFKNAAAIAMAIMKGSELGYGPCRRFL